MKYLGEDGTKKLIDLIKAKPSGKIDKILEDNGNELPIVNKSITLPKYLKGIKTSDGVSLSIDTDNNITLPASSSASLLSEINKRVKGIKTKDGTKLANDINGGIIDLTSDIPQIPENLGGHKVTDKLPDNPVEDNIEYVVLKPDNSVKGTYIYKNGQWYETMGGAVSIDLSNYYNKPEVDNLITQTENKINNKDTQIMAQVAQKVNEEATIARTKENEIKSSLNDHINNSVIHVTQEDKDKWNNNIIDLTPFNNHISNNEIHVTQADKDRWNRQNRAFYVTQLSDLPLTGNEMGNLGYVRVSAEGVTPITCKVYMWIGTAWEELNQGEISMNVNWNSIIGKPISSPERIDDAVNKSHKHNNLLSLNKISQTPNGGFLWDGTEIGVRVKFYQDDDEIPQVGEKDVLYIVYQDKRINRYSSISIFENGTYKILGRGEHYNPPSTGTPVVLQAEATGANINSDLQFAIAAASDDFAYLPMEVLEEAAGKTDQNKEIFNFKNENNFKYNKKCFLIKNGLIIKIADEKTTNTSNVGHFYSEVEINMNHLKDIDLIS